jgi:formylglycine-generating enzyme required for sulfatase activity
VAARRNAASQQVIQRAPELVQQFAPPPPTSFVRIEGGTFMMGEPAWQGADVHQVTVRSFYIEKYEVTVADFRRFVNATGYQTTAETSGGGGLRKPGKYIIYKNTAGIDWKNPGILQEDNHPVVQVSWFDAVQYCNWLSSQDKLSPVYTIDGKNVIWNRTANGYRLPTEAEWEYACRAGTTTKYYTGDELTPSQENIDEGTKTIGSYPPNPWGLYDMHENVWEHCWDFYRRYFSSQIDPIGPTSGTYRARRGGGSGERGFGVPSGRQPNIGFRIARNLAE